MINKGADMAYDTALIRIKVSEENSEHEKSIEDLEGYLNRYWTIDRVDTLNDGSLLYILTREDRYR